MRFLYSTQVVKEKKISRNSQKASIERSKEVKMSLLLKINSKKFFRCENGNILGFQVTDYAQLLHKLSKGKNNYQKTYATGCWESIGSLMIRYSGLDDRMTQLWKISSTFDGTSGSLGETLCTLSSGISSDSSHKGAIKTKPGIRVECGNMFISILLQHDVSPTKVLSLEKNGSLAGFVTSAALSDVGLFVTVVTRLRFRALCWTFGRDLFVVVLSIEGSESPEVSVKTTNF